jgi:hypothetical protein
MFATGEEDLGIARVESGHVEKSACRALTRRGEAVTVRATKRNKSGYTLCLTLLA